MPVIDASIAVKWFAEEPDSPAARRLLDAHASGDTSLIAPDLLVYEVANALLHNSAFSPAEVRRCIESLYDVQIELIAPSAELVSATIMLAATKRLTFYDALYVQLAHDIGASLYTADRKLIATLHDPDVRSP